ncbi:MAG: hypothetical protein P8Y58_16540, partial [Novosphingobium sp.]
TAWDKARILSREVKAFALAGLGCGARPNAQQGVLALYCVNRAAKSKAFPEKSEWIDRTFSGNVVPRRRGQKKRAGTKPLVPAL